MSTYVIQIIPNPNSANGLPATFNPPGAVAAPYDTIIWHNGDEKNPHYPAPIIVNQQGQSTVQKNGWFDNQIAPGGTSDTLAPGPIPSTSPPTLNYVLKYACALHPGETGQITIQPKS
jgi:hypothetical protein